MGFPEIKPTADTMRSPDWAHESTVVANYGRLGFVDNPNQLFGRNAVPVSTPEPSSHEPGSDAEEDVADDGQWARSRVPAFMSSIAAELEWVWEGSTAGCSMLPRGACSHPRSTPSMDPCPFSFPKDLRAVLGKVRSTGRAAPKRLTKHQRDIVARLIVAHGDDTRAMMMDRKLNPMQHSEGALHKLIASYRHWGPGAGVEFRVPVKGLW